MQLNNIVSISYVHFTLIDGFVRISPTEAVMSENVPFAPIDNFKRPAQLVISDKIDGGNRVYTAKLTFLTCEGWLANPDRLAFLCKTIDGKYYLIGTEERPYPIVTQQDVHPNNLSDNQLVEVSVNYSAAQICPNIIKFL